jgi:hypothetical protein
MSPYPLLLIIISGVIILYVFLVLWMSEPRT